MSALKPILQTLLLAASATPQAPASLWRAVLAGSSAPPPSGPADGNFPPALLLSSYDTSVNGGFGRTKKKAICLGKYALDMGKNISTHINLLVLCGH